MVECLLIAVLMVEVVQIALCPPDQHMDHHLPLVDPVHMAAFPLIVAQMEDKVQTVWYHPDLHQDLQHQLDALTEGFLLTVAQMEELVQTV